MKKSLLAGILETCILPFWANIARGRMGERRGREEAKGLQGTEIQHHNLLQMVIITQPGQGGVIPAMGLIRLNWRAPMSLHHYFSGPQ